MAKCVTVTLEDHDVGIVPSPIGCSFVPYLTDIGDVLDNRPIDDNAILIYDINLQKWVPKVTGSSTLITQRFQFTDSLVWLVEHNLNTVKFHETLTDENGDKFYAKVTIIDENSFEINMTEAMSGFVDVIFTL